MRIPKLKFKRTWRVISMPRVSYAVRRDPFGWYPELDAWLLKHYKR